LLVKFWTLCVLEPPYGGLGSTYTIHIRLIGKRVLIELFSLAVMVEALRANIE